VILEGYIQKTRNNSMFLGGPMNFVVCPVFFESIGTKARDGKQ
jgi:hypothetical protein